MLAGRIRAVVIVSALAAAVALPAASAAGAPAASTDWPSYERNIQHSSASFTDSAITQANASQLNAKWTFTLPGPTRSGQPNATLWSSPTVVGGKVYIGSGTGVFYALNASHRQDRLAAPAGLRRCHQLRGARHCLDGDGGSRSGHRQADGVRRRSPLPLRARCRDRRRQVEELRRTVEQPGVLQLGLADGRRWAHLHGRLVGLRGLPRTRRRASPTASTPAPFSTPTTTCPPAASAGACGAAPPPTAPRCGSPPAIPQ